MIWAGAAFDFFDGFAARMLKSQSPIGKDLDSLADIVTFCFLPASILFALAEQTDLSGQFAYATYLLVIFGALRLAKFNNDERQGDHFYGLPVPASAIFVSAWPFLNEGYTGELATFLTNGYTIIGVAALLSLLMVSDVQLMSLKFSNFSLKANWQKYLLLLMSLILLLFLQIVAFPIIIILYVVFSLLIIIAK